MTPGSLLDAIGIVAVVPASFAGLVLWSDRVPTRALGNARMPATSPMWLAAAGASQWLAAASLAGIVAGTAIMAGAWMLTGWTYVLALNRWATRARDGALTVGIGALILAVASAIGASI